MIVLPDGKLATCCKAENRIKVWNVHSHNDEPVIEYFDRKRSLSPVPFGVLSNGLLLATYMTRNDISIKIFDTLQLRHKRSVTFDIQYARTLYVLSNDLVVINAGGSKSFIVDLAQKSIVCSLDQTQIDDCMYGYLQLPNGIFIGTADHRLQAWKPDNGEKFNLSLSVPESDDAVRFQRLMLSRDKKFFIALLNRTKVCFFNIEE